MDLLSAYFAQYQRYVSGMNLCQRNRLVDVNIRQVNCFLRDRQIVRLAIIEIVFKEFDHLCVDYGLT